MNKQILIKKIVAQLISELEGYVKAAQLAHAEATSDQSKAENKYDTRGLEASYLAHGQARQVMEVEEAIATLESMDGRPFAENEPMGVGALVVLEHDGNQLHYFICSRAGGMEVVQNQKSVLVITLQSPLGAQLKGKKQGDLLQLTFGGKKNQYRVVEVN